MNGIAIQAGNLGRAFDEMVAGFPIHGGEGKQKMSSSYTVKPHRFSGH